MKLRAAIVLLAATGAGIAAYLSYSRLTDTSLICPTSGCATVQRSSYATLAGVPVAYLGVAGYLAIAAAAVMGRRLLTTVLVLVAAGFGTYLLVAQLAFVHAVCVWCLSSDAVAYSLVLVAGAAFLRAPRGTSKSLVVSLIAAVVAGAAAGAALASSSTRTFLDPIGDAQPGTADIGRVGISGSGRGLVFRTTRRHEEVRLHDALEDAPAGVYSDYAPDDGWWRYAPAPR